MRNVIHKRMNGCGCYGSESAGMYVDSTDRGPKGNEGKKGEKGDPGDKGNPGNDGVSVVKVSVDKREHLLVEFSNGRRTDLGEIPKIVTQRVFTTEITGNTKKIELSSQGVQVVVDESRISFILINGVMYTDEYHIEDNNLVLDIENIPAGKLEVFTNSHLISSAQGGGVSSVNGKTGDIVIENDIIPISTSEIGEIIKEDEE